MIDAPVEAVFGFHERDEALKLLTPPFPPVKIRRTGRLEPGARVELSSGPMRWIAVHRAYEKNRLFVDEQVDGPFRRWIHRHEFEDFAGKTRLTDRVEYDAPGGAMANALVRPLLAALFAYRHRVTQRECERR